MGNKTRKVFQFQQTGPAKGPRLFGRHAHPSTLGRPRTVIGSGPEPTVESIQSILDGIWTRIASFAEGYGRFGAQFPEARNPAGAALLDLLGLVPDFPAEGSVDISPREDDGEIDPDTRSAIDAAERQANEAIDAAEAAAQAATLVLDVMEGLTEALLNQEAAEEVREAAAAAAEEFKKAKNIRPSPPVPPFYKGPPKLDQVPPKQLYPPVPNPKSPGKLGYVPEPRPRPFSSFLSAILNPSPVTQLQMRAIELARSQGRVKQPVPFEEQELLAAPPGAYITNVLQGSRSLVLFPEELAWAGGKASGPVRDVRPFVTDPSPIDDGEEEPPAGGPEITPFAGNGGSL